MSSFGMGPGKGRGDSDASLRAISVVPNGDDTDDLERLVDGIIEESVSSTTSTTGAESELLRLPTLSQIFDPVHEDKEDDLQLCEASLQRVEKENNLQPAVQSLRRWTEVQGNAETNERTLYGGYRLRLAEEAKSLAQKIQQIEEKSSSRKRRRKHTLFPSMIPVNINKGSLAQAIYDLRRTSKATIYLICLGVCASTFEYGMDLTISGLTAFRFYLLRLAEDSVALYFFIWTAFILCLGSVAVFWTLNIDPSAAGSGIPEMKTIMSGDMRREPERYLTRRMLLAKAGGLTCAVGAGLSIGREGPFVHISSIVAHQLMKKFTHFRQFYENESIRRQMYVAACAVGVSSTFATHIGGLLFSIEVTSAFYLVSNYYRGFLAALSGAIVTQLLNSILRGNGNLFEPKFSTSFSVQTIVASDLLGFALIGISCGLLGPLYIRVMDLSRRLNYVPLHSHPQHWSAVIIILVAILLYGGGVPSRSGVQQILDDLFSPDPLPDYWTVYGSLGLGLLTFGAVRIVATALSLTLPVPSGDFIPNFLTGAAIGRLIGEMLSSAFPEANIIPGAYALVGAASLVAAVTHTISAAVITLEMTGQIRYIFPVFLGVMIAYGIAQMLSDSVYDFMVIRKGLPYLPMLRFDKMLTTTAADLMDCKLTLLTTTTTYAEIIGLLRGYHFSQFPLVEDRNLKFFHGCVSRHDLLSLVFEYYRDNNLPGFKEDLSPVYTSMKRVSKSLAESVLANARPATATELKGRSALRSERILALLPEIKQTEKLVAVNKDELLSRQVDLTDLRNVVIDRSAFRIDEETPAEEVRVLFEMLRCSKVFVQSFGVLVGVISRRSLYFRLHYLSTMKPQDNQT